MGKTKTFRRGRSRRRGLLLTLAVLVVAGALTAGVWALTGRQSNGPADPSPSDGSAVTTAGTTVPADYPGLSAETTAQLDSTVTARCVLLYDETHDKRLYARNETEPASPASLTKLMTAAVAAKYAAGDPYPVGSELSLCDPQASSAYLRAGMTLSLDQMLEALLLPSGADAAYSLAVNTARRLAPEEELSDFAAAERFCDLMNETAAAIGANDTRFINPDGIYHTNHTTTAADLLTILQYARSFPQVRAAIALPSVSFTTADGKTLSYTNTNRLLNVNTPYYYPCATGGKTGHTDEAGYCLAASAEQNGVSLLVILLNCPEENARFTEAAALFNAGFALAESGGV